MKVEKLKFEHHYEMEHCERVICDGCQKIAFRCKSDNDRALILHEALCFGESLRVLPPFSERLGDR